MQYVQLTLNFFNDYPYPQYSEIEQKQNRPYVLTIVNIQDYKFAIPLRSSAKHKWKFSLPSKDNSALDFKKSIYISDDNYFTPFLGTIRQTDFNYLKGKENLVEKKFMEYLKEYVEAIKTSDPNKQGAFKYSTLSYFSDKINYEDLIDKYFNKTTV